jgi:hypothetical protein
VRNGPGQRALGAYAHAYEKAGSSPAHAASFRLMLLASACSRGVRVPWSPNEPRPRALAHRGLVVPSRARTRSERPPLSATSGLSRRRSRVRVPSLPSPKTSAKHCITLPAQARTAVLKCIVCCPAPLCARKVARELPANGPSLLLTDHGRSKAAAENRSTSRVLVDSSAPGRFRDRTSRLPGVVG